MEVVFQRETSLVWQHNLMEPKNSVMEIKWKLNDAIYKTVPENGVQENGHHVLRLVVTVRNKGKLQNVIL